MPTATMNSNIHPPHNHLRTTTAGWPVLSTAPTSMAQVKPEDDPAEDEEDESEEEDSEEEDETSEEEVRGILLN